MKTYENWNEPLNEYLQIGDIVDEEMADYFVEVLPPVTFTNSIVQIGEAYSHINGRATYNTLVNSNEGWMYCGHCHKGATTEPTEERLMIKLIKSTGCLVLESADGTEQTDYQFINLYELEQMSIPEIEAEAIKIADRNYLNKFRVDLSDYYSI